MRTTRTMAAGVVALVVLVATACYPPSQTPTDQPIPPGGRVVATGPILTEMLISDTTEDLSRILYGRYDFVLTTAPLPYRYWVYDDTTGTTTEVPVGQAEQGMASLSPDGRSVVFSSNDARLQVGPTAVNCAYVNGPFVPDTPAMCDELYIFDLDTGETRQLTGLDGSSTVDHAGPKFTADGQAIEYVTYDGTWFPQQRHHRLDLATGVVQDAAPTHQPTSWDRGTHVVEWSGSALTSTDKATGAVTTLWDEAGYSLADAKQNGRFVVVLSWLTEQLLVHRLIDTDTGSVRVVPSPWISEDGSQVAFVQRNVAPEAIDRLVLAPVLG